MKGWDHIFKSSHTRGCLAHRLHGEEQSSRAVGLNPVPPGVYEVPFPDSLEAQV